MIAPTFDVIGLPAPQGSKTAMIIAGKPRVLEGKSGQREKHRTWRQAVMEAAKDWLLDHPQPPIDEPMTLVMEFRMERPGSAKYRTRHASTPDLSKLVRSTEDSLTNAQLIRDDSRFWKIIATKRYVRPGELPGCTVAIELDGEAELQDREALKSIAATTRRKAQAASVTHVAFPL